MRNVKPERVVLVATVFVRTGIVPSDDNLFALRMQKKIYNLWLFPLFAVVQAATKQVLVEMTPEPQHWRVVPARE